MNVEKLARRLDQLDYGDRLIELTKHVRERSDADAAALGQALAQGDAHRRLLALHVAAVRRDAAAALAALDDASLIVRHQAAVLTGRLAERLPEDLVDRVDARSLARIISELLRRRRRELGQALCESLCARERLVEAARLLPVCSIAWLTERLESVAWPDAAWERLAKHRPDLMCDRIERQFTEVSDRAGRPEQVFNRYSSGVWAQLCERRPQRVVEWIDRHVGKDELPFVLLAGLEWLYVALPGRMVEYLATRPTWLAQLKVPRALVTRVRGLDDDQLAPLCEQLAQTQPAQLGALLSQLPYPRRAELFARATEKLETSRTEWPLELLRALPRELAEREAARMLGLSRAATDGRWRRELLGHRDIAQARALIEKECQSAQASERGEALAALVTASARAATGLGETLAYLRRIANDQDPVRLAAIAALAQVPGHRFDDPAALDTVVSPIFDARDTSWGTRQQVARLAHNLIIANALTPKSPAFALGVSLLDRLAVQLGTRDLPQLDRNLPRGAEQAIVDALMPWVRAAQSRQQDQHALRLWSALGKRAWRVPELAKVIVEVMWHGNKNHAAHAAALWLQDPATRDARVCELVRKDRSALYLHPVFEHCSWRRQTLLPERMSTKAPRGRFHDGKVAIVPWVRRGLHCWPTELQQKYVELIRAAEAAPKQFTTTRARMVALRARVPITTAADLSDALASSDVPVQEAALGALVWLDAPEPALPILLEHLDGDRARVAMYAMPRLARLLPRSRMVDAIVKLLARRKLKVTVHKEALRLLGTLATPRAVELLREAWARALHRDVRIAALHAARSVPWAREAWAILASAATDESPDVARALVEVPIATIAERHRGAYLELMLRTADHPSPEVRAALFATLGQRWSWVDPLATVRVAARVIERRDPLDPWTAAGSIVAQGASSKATHPIIDHLVDTLAQASERELEVAGERDRLAHRQLLAVIDALARVRHPTSLVLLDALGRKLLARAEFWAQGVRSCLTATANNQMGARMLELCARAPTPRSICAIESVARNLAELDERDWSRKQAESVVEQLVAGPAAGRLVGVAMLEPFGERFGWGEPWEGTLVRLRGDEDLDVRTAARGVWISED